MSELLIFGGTTEGRLLAEFCASHAIPCTICVTTDYGAALLPEAVTVQIGRLDAEAMCRLLRSRHDTLVIDATHPYAREATENIRLACARQGVPCQRLVRRRETVSGEIVGTMAEMLALLNACDDTILSTLGSKSLPALTQVWGFRERVWVRMLPSAEMAQEAASLGFDVQHLLLLRGPFSVGQNIAHIRQSGAAILLTKESGAIGGYPEKAEAARQCGIRLITLARPDEDGQTLAEIETALLQASGTAEPAAETEGIL